MLKIAEYFISKDEIVVKEKECKFMLSVETFVFMNLLIQHKFKYFNKVKTSFYRCADTRPKIHKSFNGVFNCVNYTGLGNTGSENSSYYMEVSENWGKMD